MEYVILLVIVFIITFLIDRLQEMKKRRDALKMMNDEYSKIIRKANILNVPPRYLTDEDMED